MPKSGSLRGLGAKYGSTVRKRYTRVMRVLKAKRACPACGRIKFKREAVGIWRCGSCGHVVAGGAWDVS